MWNLKFQHFLWIFSKKSQNFKKMKIPILDNFILFLKINESHFLIKPNFCYAIQEKLDGYYGYWWISRKPHNLQKSLTTIGFIWLFWFQKCILLYIFVQVFLVMRCIRSHISFFRLGLTPTLKIYDPLQTMILERTCELQCHLFKVLVNYYTVISISMEIEIKIVI